MGKIPEHNARFRTKSQIVKDLVTVLRSDVSYGTRFAVLADIVWVWSEYSGKYAGCHHWSQRALKHRAEIKELRHEHIVPKKVIMEKIFGLKVPTKPKVRDILDRFCVGCVVTRGEDEALNRAGLRSRMPTDWDGENPWARYDHVDIKFVCVEDGSRTELNRLGSGDC